MQSYFDQLEQVRYEGTSSNNPLAFRHYNPDEIILGKRMADHLRFAACYWHTFCWNGADMFGIGAFDRPWQQPGEALELAKRKADVAFEFFHKLNVPYYCFHDIDVSPEGATLKEYLNNFAVMTDVLAEKQQSSGVKLLWGTANCFTHPRYGAGAATNPDPEVFSWAATQVFTAMNATHKLGVKTMCCGAGVKAMKPCSIPICVRSVNRLAALCRWWLSTNIRSASRVHC